MKSIPKHPRKRSDHPGRVLDQGGVEKVTKDGYDGNNIEPYAADDTIVWSTFTNEPKLPNK